MGKHELPGFTRYPAAATADLDARLAELERPEWSLQPGVAAPPDEEVALAAVTRWFAWAVGDYADVGLGNGIVSWVSAHEVVRPDLDGLFAQYRRAALAECAAWEGIGARAHGSCGPSFESWYGYRSLCRQDRLDGLARAARIGARPGLPVAADDDAERTIAALLIADAADYVLTAEPPYFGGGYGPSTRPPAGAADPATLPRLLREAARAGVMPCDQ